MTTCQSIDSTPYMYVHVDVTQENLLATVFPSLLCGDWGLGFTWVFFGMIDGVSCAVCFLCASAYREV